MIKYRVLQTLDEAKITEVFGDWVVKYQCLHFEENAISIAAFHKDNPVGFISLYQEMEDYSDIFIDVLNVASQYQGKGIATALVSLAEEWARRQDYHQIRAWSSDDKIAAIALWHKLGYGICPAIMRGDSLADDYDNERIPGVYAVKVLRSN